LPPLDKVGGSNCVIFINHWNRIPV